MTIPLNINVYFDLPFVVWVRDSMSDPELQAWANAYAKGEEPLPYSRYAPTLAPGQQIIIGGLLPVYIPPGELADYYLTAAPGRDGVQCGLRFLRRANTRGNFHVMGECSGDRVGRVSFSSVCVMFDLSQLGEGDENRYDVLAELAVVAVNHFINHYRVIANRPWVNAITTAMVNNFSIVTIYDDESQHSVEYGAAQGPLSGFGGALDVKSDLELRSAVENSEPPSIVSTLDANVRNYLDLQDWRMAVIEAAVLFEAWLIPAVKERFVQNGVSHSDVEGKFLNANGQARSVSHVAKVLVREACALNFEASSECQDWTNHAANIRNELVHGARLDVSRQEAYDAYRSVRAAMTLIRASM